MSRWALVDSTPVLQNQWLQVKKKTYAREGQSSTEEYFVVERSAFVVVVALDGNDLLMVRHYRHGTDATYLELPAGYLEPGESAEAAARRELLEETGYEATESKLIGVLHPLPGYVRSSASVVVCGDLRHSGAAFDSHEIEEVLRVPSVKAVDMIKSGEINEMQAASAILLANAFRPLA